jgi:hypothetical protein
VLAGVVERQPTRRLVLIVFQHGITVEVIAVARDRYGDTTETVVGSIAGCGFAPGSSTENTDNQAQVGTVESLYSPPTTVPVNAQSKIRFPDGVVWHVDGEPEWWRHPMTGWSPGGVIRLRRVTG